MGSSRLVIAAKERQIPTHTCQTTAGAEGQRLKGGSGVARGRTAARSTFGAPRERRARKADESQRVNFGCVTRCGRATASRSVERRHSSFSSLCPLEDVTPVWPSKARMWVAIRSRSQRWWEVTSVPRAITGCPSERGPTPTPRCRPRARPRSRRPVLSPGLDAVTSGWKSWPHPPWLRMRQILA